MLKKRILTAIILIPILLALLFFLPPAYFCLLTAFIILAAAWEWSKLMGIKRLAWRLFYLVVMVFVLFNTLFVPIQLVLLIAFIWWLLATIQIIIYPKGSHWWGKSIFWRGLVGLFVLVPCWAALCYTRIQDDGIFGLLFLLVLIWGADSSAYFVGKKWGKNKLIPQVSPGKTWEGLFAAIVFSLFLGLITFWLFQMPLKIGLLGTLLTLITVLFSVIGDLFESLLKRQVKIKDSGRLLPGHGGLLDRIDSLTAAAPIFALGALLIGSYWG